MFDVISEQGCRVVSSMYPVLTVNKSVQVEINNRVPSYTGTWNFSSAGTASWGSDIPLSQPMLPPIYSATSPVAFTRGYPINGNHGWSIYGDIGTVVTLWTVTPSNSSNISRYGSGLEVYEESGRLLWSTNYRAPRLVGLVESQTGSVPVPFLPVNHGIMPSVFANVELDVKPYQEYADVLWGSIGYAVVNGNLDRKLVITGDSVESTPYAEYNPPLTTCAIFDMSGL
ncbi:hypothetical protein ACFWQD_07900 [Alcaligenes faecalis]|uniref:hypothetical protein n=2 Tax=Bacteria TaxID=2 RepID=UPI00365BA478